MNAWQAWRAERRNPDRGTWGEFWRSTQGRRAATYLVGYLAAVVTGEVVYFGALWLVGFWTMPGGWLSAVVLLLAIGLSMPVLWVGIRITDRIARRSPT